MSDLKFSSVSSSKLNDKVITLAHGGGGRLSDQLLSTHILPALSPNALFGLHDGAILSSQSKIPVMTTDSFVVKPHFFPGGDIGRLAVIGTLNDLAMCGARPHYLSCSFILSEGLPINTLTQVLASMKATLEANGVYVVTGDTKVIERQSEPELIINTTGLGYVAKSALQPNAIQEDDAIILSGDLGRHGLCIMAVRHELDFTPAIESDCQALWPCIEKLLNEDIEIHCARDLTRGGFTAALLELAHQCKAQFLIEASRVPVSDPVHYASEILGLDPWATACEGRMILFAPQNQVESVLTLLKEANPSQQPVCVGLVEKLVTKPEVRVRNSFGVTHLLEKSLGDQLPRIC